MRFKFQGTSEIIIMARWSEEQTKFPVKIQYDDRSDCQITIPRPIVEKLNEPTTVVFEIKKNGSISVNTAD